MIDIKISIDHHHGHHHTNNPKHHNNTTIKHQHYYHLYSHNQLIFHPTIYLPNTTPKMPSYTSIIYLTAAFIGATSALPSAPQPITPRSCKTSYPTRMTEFTPLENPS